MCGILSGIYAAYRQYQIVKNTQKMKYFTIFLLSVFWFELALFGGIMIISKKYSLQSQHIFCYEILLLALSSLCQGIYLLKSASISSKKEKIDRFKGKVAIGGSIYFIFLVVLFWDL